MLAYERTSLNYPPLLVYWFWLAGKAEPLLARLTGLPPDKALNVALKLLPTLADLATGLALAAVPFGRRATSLGLLAAALYVFNPAIWFVSAYWGQTDSVYAFFLVLGLAALGRGALLPAWVALALAALVKQQALVVLPVAAAATLALHGWRGLGGAGAVLAVTWAAALAPWLLAGRLPEVTQAVTVLAGSPARVTVTAFNLWYLLRGGVVHNVPAAMPLPRLPISYQAAAIAVTAGATAWLAWHAWRLRQPAIALAAAAACTLPYVFMFHARERYLFPVLALLLLALAQHSLSRRAGLALYGALTIIWLFNLLAIVSPVPTLWTNLVASTAATPLIFVLRALALAVAAWHSVAGVGLLWLAGRGRTLSTDRHR